MISAKLLRDHSFFAIFNEAQLKAISEIVTYEDYQQGAEIFEEGMKAEALYVLLTGRVELSYTIIPSYHPERRKESVVSEINPGEVFGISALIEPHILTMTARATQSSRVIRFEAGELRRLMKGDQEMAYVVIDQLAKSAIQRLNATRRQLATAWEPL